MADEFTMRIADANVHVHALHDDVRRACADYIIDEASAAASGGYDLTVHGTEHVIEHERSVCPPDTNHSDAYLEYVALHRLIAQWAPTQRRLLMHGAVIEYEGRAYLFGAASGTGKSTHIKLWRTHLGPDVRIVNGDKPLVHVPSDKNKNVLAYGTPWCGKEGWNRNVAVPLAGIVLLARAERPGANMARRIEPPEGLERIILQVYLPNEAHETGLTLELLDELLERVPLYELACDMSEDAVRTSFECLTGKDYDACREVQAEASA